MGDRLGYLDAIRPPYMISAEWGFVLAVPATTAVESLQFERLEIEGKQRFVSQEMLAQLMNFPPDSEQIATQINTLDHPVLMRYHASDWSQWNE